MQRIPTTYPIETVPASIRPYVSNAALYDSSCSEHAQTLFVDGFIRSFLKISAAGTLEREARMTAFLHRHGLAPDVIHYTSDGKHDYMLTAAVIGEDATAAHHLAQPERLAAAFGTSLRKLHATPAAGCPCPKRSAEMRQQLIDKGISTASLDAIGYTPQDCAVIHGDYCLPNIIMDQFDFRAFLDVGYGGVGDIHFDLYWGIWTLQYNLHTDAYRDTFLDAYGRDRIDEAGLRYFAALVQLEG